MTILLFFSITLRESRPRKKDLNYLTIQSCVTSNRFIFFQKTHPSISDENKAQQSG